MADKTDMDKDWTRLLTDDIEFMAGLPEEKKKLLLERAERQVCPRGGALFLEDDPADALYIIFSGRVKLSTVDSDGREQIVGIFADNETIWEGVFISGSRYPYSAICLTPVVCCRILRKDFERAVEDPAIALRVIALLSRKLHDANERNLLLSTGSPKARLAGFLLYRTAHAEGNTVTMKLDDIAASTNMRPETVSRKIKELELEGLIARTGQSSIELLDPEGLRAVFEE